MKKKNLLICLMCMGIIFVILWLIDDSLNLKAAMLSSEKQDYYCVVTPCFTNVDGTCEYESYVTIYGAEPKVWSLNFSESKNETETLSVKGFEHLHTANVVEKTLILTGIDSKGTYQCFKYDGDKIISKIKLETLPYKSYPLGNTVALLFVKDDSTCELYKADFESGELQLISDCVYCNSNADSVISDLYGSANVFTYQNVIFYKIGTGTWNFQFGDTERSYELDGICGGFSDEDTVVFYREITNNAPLYSIKSHRFFKVGKIEKISLPNGKIKESKTLKLPSDILNFFAYPGYNEVLIEYGNLDDTANGMIINLDDYSYKTMHWYPPIYSNIQICDENPATF